MIWLTWRQFRTQAVAIAIAIGALLVALAVTGPGLFDSSHLYGQAFLSRLQFNKLDKFLYVLALVVMYIAPAVIGAFWGAPLIARELEAGTHRLVWNQSTTRNRWLGTKVGVIGLAGLVAAGLLTSAVSWWSGPIDRAVARGGGIGPFSLPRLDPTVFGARGIVPVGYLLFALAVGITLGLLIRRSVAAIALTLVVVAFVQIAMPLWVRSHLATPAIHDVTITIDTFGGIMVDGDSRGRPTGTVHNLRVRTPAPADWVLSNNTINAAGVVQKSLPSWLGTCLAPPPPGQPEQAAPVPRQRGTVAACLQRLTDLGYKQRVTYQPAGRFWTLQWRETSLLLATAFLLLGLCFWRIRRDLS
jgi:ABC-type transport system involved in multi-copper enzyme maturation permease subunit